MSLNTIKSDNKNNKKKYFYKTFSFISFDFGFSFIFCLGFNIELLVFILGYCKILYKIILFCNITMETDAVQ